MKKYRLLLCMMIMLIMTSIGSAQWVWVSSDDERTISYENSFQRIYVDGVEAVSIWQKQYVRAPEFFGYVICEYAYDLKTDKYFLVNATLTSYRSDISMPLLTNDTGEWNLINYDTDLGGFFKIALADYHNQKENR